MTSTDEPRLEALRQVPGGRVERAVEAARVAVELVAAQRRGATAHVGERKPCLGRDVERELKRRHLQYAVG